jgi:hypothetical protein
MVEFVQAVQRRTRVFGSNCILVDEASYRAVAQEFRGRRIEVIRSPATGEEATHLYQILGPQSITYSPDVLESWAAFEAGLQEYERMQFTSAQLLFKKSNALATNTPAAVYEERCRQLAEGRVKVTLVEGQPWDGVYPDLVG